MTMTPKTVPDAALKAKESTAHENLSRTNAPEEKKMSTRDLRAAHDAAIVSEDSIKKELHLLRFKAANDGEQLFDRAEIPALAHANAGTHRNIKAEIAAAEKKLEKVRAEIIRLEELLTGHTKDIWGTTF
jgi:hypothetical protein